MDSAFDVPIVFTAVGETREAAARAVVGWLDRHWDRGPCAVTGRSLAIDCWWTLDAADKVLDGNDNAAGIVVHTDGPTYLLHCSYPDSADFAEDAYVGPFPTLAAAVDYDETTHAPCGGDHEYVPVNLPLREDAS